MASKLSSKQLKAREFILSVFRKEAPATKPTLKKLMKVYSDTDNSVVTEKYGERLISSFLSIYKFKSYKDYQDILNIMKEASVYDTGLTYYGNFHAIITKKLFDSETVRVEWIIEQMSTKGSMAEINNILVYLFKREKENLSELLNDVLQITQYTKNEKLVASTIVRHALFDSKFKDADLIQSIFDREFSKADEDVIRGIEVYFRGSRAHKSVQVVVRNWLYTVTEKDEYLPEEAKDIFLF